MEDLPVADVQETPAARDPLDDEVFRSTVQALIERARGYADDELAPSLQRSWRYFRGEVDALPANFLGHDEVGNDEYEGSRIVVRECWDRVQAMLPEIARVFLASDEAVAFTPTGPEDEAAAEQATDVANFCWRVENDGENLLSSSLLDWCVKFCCFKVYRDVESSTTRHEFSGLSEAALVSLQQEAESGLSDIVELAAEPEGDLAPAEKLPGLTSPGLPAGAGAPSPPIAAPGPGGMPVPPAAPASPGPAGPMPGMPPMPPPAPPPGTPPIAPLVPVVSYRGYLVREQRRSRIKIELLPQDELLLDPDARDGDEPLIVGQDGWRTVSDLVAMGVDPADALAHKGTLPFSIRSGVRDARSGRLGGTGPQSPGLDDESLEYVRTVEALVRVDLDRDGVAERYRVLCLGDSHDLYAVSRGDDCEYVIGSPFRVPHEVIGRGLVEELIDLQDIKTSLVRDWLDNFRRSNHPREVVSSTDAEGYQDLQSWYGGPIRSAQPDALGWHQVPFVGQQAMPLIQFFDQVGSMRTGIDPAGAGLNPDVLKGQTAAGAGAIVAAPQSRMEFLIREYAIRVMRPLFRALLRLMVRFPDKPRTIRLRGQWVEVDPRSWNASFDAEPRVGLGSGTRQEKLLSLMILLQQQKELMAVGSPLVTLKELRATLVEMLNLQGRKDSARYFKEITDQELAQLQAQQAQQAQAQLQMAAQLEAAKEQAKAQARAQVDLQKAQLDNALKDKETAARLQADMRQFEITQAHAEKAGEREAALLREKQAAQVAATRDKTVEDAAAAKYAADLKLVADRERIAMEREAKLAELEMRRAIRLEELRVEAELERIKIRAQDRAGQGNVEQVEDKA